MLGNMEEDNSRAECDILGEEICMLFKTVFDAMHVNTTFSERAEYLCEKARHNVIYKNRSANTNAKNSTSEYPYSTLAQKWPVVRNHMTNEVRILVCKLFLKDKAPADMARYIHLNTKYWETNHSPALDASIVVTKPSSERSAVLKLNTGMESLTILLGVWEKIPRHMSGWRGGLR